MKRPGIGPLTALAYVLINRRIHTIEQFRQLLPLAGADWPKGLRRAFRTVLAPVCFFLPAIALIHRQRIQLILDPRGHLHQFLRRFLLHLLPKGFVRIRNFGFLASRRRATLLPLCFQLLGVPQEAQAEQNTSCTPDLNGLWRCSKCGGPMVVVKRFTAAEIQLRSPPVSSAAA